MVYVNDSFIVPELIVEIYKFMISMEARIELEPDPPFREGQQDGFIMCWTMLFGSVSDQEAEEAHDEHRSLFDVIGNIMGVIKNKVNFPQYTNCDIDQWSELQDQLDSITEAYVKTHYSECFDAVRKL